MTVPSYSTLEVQDFSGGITDYYVGAPLNKYQEAENLILVKHGKLGKLITRPGSVIYEEDDEQIPAGAQRISSMKYFESKLFVQSSRKFYYLNATPVWTALQGPSSNDPWPSGIDTTSVMIYSSWNGHLFMTSDGFTRVQKVYTDDAGDLQLRTAGLPALGSTPTITAGAAGAGSYLYAFCRKYTYMVGTKEFVDRGPFVYGSVSSCAAPDSNAVAITSIENLSNGSTHNYDTADAGFVIEVYRTIDGGADYYYVGEVANGTTSYNDSTSDASLVSNEAIYTAGGVVENDPPPLCKLLHVTEDNGYYAHVQIGTEVFKNRIYQSIAGDVDSVPATFFEEVEDDIVGMSSVRGTPILACANSAYRIDGEFDLLGRGAMTSQKISDACSCVSAASMVQTLDGVFWAGLDGFYYSDGYQVIKINTGWDQRYENLVSSSTRQARIIGKYDPQRKRVWWTCQYETDATDCDRVFVLDLNFGISDDMPFTYCTDGYGDGNFKPTAIEIINGDLIRADTRGYIFQHSSSYYTDPYIDTGTAAANWDEKTIIYNLKTAATNFGTDGQRKWVPRVRVTCLNETNLSLQINSIDDDGRRTTNLKPIRSRGNLVWGDENAYWGDPDLIWNFAGLIDRWRRLPPKSLRVQYKQFQLTNAKVAIINSELLGTATVSNSGHTATLDDTATYDWPTNSKDYLLSFAADSYTAEYEVTARTADVLTFTDTNSLVPDGSTNWVLRGYPKGEVLYLQSLVINYAIFGIAHGQFDSSTTGEVGASST